MQWGKASKKKCKTLDIVQTGGRGSGDRMKCPNLLKCWAEEKCPKTKEFIDKWKENIDLFGVQF